MLYPHLRVADKKLINIVNVVIENKHIKFGRLKIDTAYVRAVK